MEKEKVIGEYKEFVKRQKLVGRSSHDIYCMAYAYLEALAHTGNIEYTEELDLLDFAEEVGKRGINP